MTISAQVIDTIVEWIDDNLHQPLRIDDIARHAGYSKWHLQRLFLQYKGRAWGAIFAKGSCCWPPAICATPISGSTISASSMALIRNRPLPASLPGPSISRRAPTAKRTTVAPTEARLSGLTLEENQRRHQRSTRYSMAPSAKNHRQNSTV